MFDFEYGKKEGGSAWSQNAQHWPWYGKVAVAWVFVGMWHGWEFLVMAIISQRNGGQHAFRVAIFAGTMAMIMYTAVWTMYLIFEDVSTYIFFVYFGTHASLCSGWYFCIMRYLPTRKRDAGFIFYMYVIIYCFLFTIGGILRVFCSPSFATCHFIWLGSFWYSITEAPVLYLILKKDTSYWRHIADELSQISAVHPMVLTRSMDDLDTLQTIVGEIVPIFDFRLLIAEELLGAGATATVERCTYHGRRKQTVAVKSFVSHDLKMSDIAIIFREAFISRKMTHPNVVQLLGLAFRPPEVCIVYEFCNQGNLLQYISSTPKKPFTIRCQLLVDAARGLEFLHQNNIAHRDIKGGNILVHKSTGKITAKLCDFGTAKRFLLSRKGSLASQISPTTTLSTRGSFLTSLDVHDGLVNDRELSNLAVSNSLLTRPRRARASFGSRNSSRIIHNFLATTRVGTPLYLAPEILKHLEWEEPFGVVIRDEEVYYDLSIDIYSFAMVMWEVFMEKPVYSEEHNDIDVVIRKVVDEDFRPYVNPPSDTLEKQYIHLMTLSWNANPQLRPVVKDLVENLIRINEGVMKTNDFEFKPIRIKERYNEFHTFDCNRSVDTPDSTWDLFKTT